MPSFRHTLLHPRGVSCPPRPLVVVAAVIPLVLGVMSALPVQASPPTPAQPVTSAQPTARPWETNQSAPGSATSAVPLATPAPLVVAPNGEVPSLRTQSSQTFAKGGRMQTVLSPTPVNYRNAAGAWAPIDETLVPQTGGSFRNAADNLTATLPATSSSPVVSAQGGVSVSAQLTGIATVAVKVSGATATYPSVLPGVDAIYEVRPNAVEQTLRLANASVPTSYASSVTLSAGLALRAEADRSVSIIDAAGKTVGALPAPVLRDSSANPDTNLSTAVSYTVAGTAPLYTVTVSVDPSWLNAPGRVFPVLLDPSTTFGTSADLGCFVASGGTPATYCSQNTGTNNPLFYGRTLYTRHMFAKFGDLTAAGSAVPADAVIDDAALTFTEESAASSGQLLTSIYRPGAAWTSAITYATQPANDGIEAEHVWVTPPGVGNTFTFHPTALVASMVSGVVANNGLEVRGWQDASVNTLDFYGFASTKHPTLTVTWQQQVGQEPWIGSYDHTLSDRMNLHVDYATRNLVLGNTDEQLAGPGQSMSVRRTYNSLTAGTATGAFGPGWTMNGGTDVSLNHITDTAVVFTQPGGAQALFSRNFAESDLSAPDAYNNAPGVNAVLTMTDSTHYRLVFDKTKTVDTFTMASTGATTAWLSSVADSDGNTLSYTASGTPLVTTGVTDTTGQRSVAFSYTTGKVTGIAETLAGSVAGRSYSYAYDGSGRLSTYTDAAANTTRYCYSGTSNLISKIITPRGSNSGATCSTVTNVDTTDITYDSSGRVTSITYENAAASPAITVSFSTLTILSTTTLGVTRDSDPYGKNTDYTYDTFDRVGKVVNPMNNPAATHFNTNNNVDSTVSANNYSGGTDPNTVYNWGTGTPQLNLLGVSLPQVGTPTAASATATYATGAFLPQNVTDDLSHQTSYTYNADNHVASAAVNGSTTTTLREGDTGVAHCGPAGAAAYKGAVCETRDPDYNSALPAEHRTLYSYDGLGELVSITTPQPDHSRATPAVWVISYDNYSRPVEITDGNNTETDYTYDSLDRAIKTELTSGNTFEQVYDQDGNLATATNYDSGHSVLNQDAMTYDALNRVATKTNDTLGTATLGWDSNSRLLTYNDAGGTVGYGYDSTGGLTSITEPGGSCTGFSIPNALPTTASLCTLIQVDKSGNRLRVVNPGDVAEQDNTYDKAGRVTETQGKGSGGATTFDYSYAYAIGTQDTAHVTSRTDKLTGNVLSYGYTPESRLTTAVTTSGGSTLASLTYCYDAAGNRLDAQTATGATCPGTANTSYDGANQILTQPFGTDAAYDANGNETDIDSAATGSSQRRQVNYTDTNQVNYLQINNSGVNLNQTYLGASNTQRLNTAVSATDADQTMNGPLGISIVTRVHNGTPGTPTYVTRDPYGNLIGLRSGSNHYYYQNDNQQSVTKVLDTSGATVNSYTYDPYGQPTATETIAQPFGYTSGYHDATTGLLKLGARYYDPTLARFTQPDPSGKEPNTYNYASCNPVNSTDPSGLFGWGDAWNGLVAAAGVVGDCITGGTFLGGIAALAGSETGPGAIVFADIGFAVGCAGGIESGKYLHYNVFQNGLD
jgi:RHS repeat-associated protein